MTQVFVAGKQTFQEGLETVQLVAQLLWDGLKSQHLNISKFETHKGFKLMIQWQDIYKLCGSPR
jgi:hypothetical protein